MPFQINGKDILRIAEIVSNDSYTGKSTYFDNTKVTIPSVVDGAKRIADAPPEYFWD